MATSGHELDAVKPVKPESLIPATRYSATCLLGGRLAGLDEAGMMSPADWEAKVAPHFGFLAERFGMTITHRDDTRWWKTSLTYSSNTVAVIISLRLDLARTEVEIARILDGKIPPRPFYIHPDSRVDRSELAQLLMLRAPSECQVLAKMGGLDPESLQVSLAFQAMALERYGADLLHGDLAVFEAIDHLRTNRLAQHPPWIPVSMPNGGSPEETQRGWLRWVWPWTRRAS